MRIFRSFVLAGLIPLSAAAQGQGAGEARALEREAILGGILLSNEEKYELTKDPRYDFGTDTPLFVLDGASVRAAADWTEADSRSCAASGGIELEISAGRIACFAF